LSVFECKFSIVLHCIKHCKEINQHDHISLYTSVTTWLAANRSTILTNLHTNNFLHRHCCWQYLQIGETRRI